MGNLHFISREFTESLLYASPLTELITASCKVTLVTIFCHPQDRLPTSSLRKAPGCRGASHDAIPWSRLSLSNCQVNYCVRQLHCRVMQKSNRASHNILAEEGCAVLLYTISSKSPNVSANNGKS